MSNFLPLFQKKMPAQSLLQKAVSNYTTKTSDAPVG